MTAEQIDRHNGRVIKHTGDGVLASFADGSAAVTCAQEIQKAFLRYRDANPGAPLHISIGMSAGEPISQSDDIFGSAVNLAARVCAQASRDEIMVAGVVRDICLGKNFPFESCGEAELKGFLEKMALYRVVWET